MPDKVVRKFKVKFNKAYAFHVGIVFCNDNTWSKGHREVYLMIFLGILDITIGLVNEGCAE